MAWLRSYGCTTAAGDNAESFWLALRNGSDLSEPAPQNTRVCLFKGPRPPSVRELLNNQLLMAFSQVHTSLERTRPFGVIFASTKGMSNDFIWNASSEQMSSDPLTPVLKDFLKRSELTPTRSLCVSNACSSTLAAIALAQHWLRQDVEQVLILAADAVTPFVQKGFQSLKLVTNGTAQPFSGSRSGFYLGEAAACLLLARESTPDALFLHEVGLDSEGSAVTRPSFSGDSLVRAAQRIPQLLATPPQVVVAHGTGTPINDETEDLAFTKLFSDLTNKPLITGTKWCAGHTLATSAALDTIAAAHALKHQELFHLHTTDSVDVKFKSQYLTRGAQTAKSFSRIMISSLGFGGMHAAALLERRAL